ncbi:MAG: FAD-dependent oxidoreductase [Mycobacteriaceae bacterium]|nr:FAD-dependent oxidoreductase [Mycobacteriaceae bacterium]
MPHVVTQSCCNDASCVYACPVNCIHPTPDEPDFGTAEMLYIDPVSCVDCGACVSACPTGAISRDTKLTADQRVFLDINAEFYSSAREYNLMARPVPMARLEPSRGTLRVAIVGSGPAAMYAADELLARPTGEPLRVQVDMYERLSQPYGLVRHGVAPDHADTKRVGRVFDRIRREEGFTLRTNVEVGKDIPHDDLRRRYDAVIYAVGAATDRKLDVPGVDLPGVASATDFVAWYNGHPDHADRDYDLSARRAVVIGNGNVALDVARILLTDPNRLADTTIAPRALAALRHSKIEEVVVAGRRGPLQSAFTTGELSGLLASPDLDVVIEADLSDPVGAADFAATQKLRMLRAAAGRSVGDRKRIVFRYQLSPTRILGAERAEQVEFAHTALTLGDDGSVAAAPADERELVDAGLVLTSIGYHGVPIPGLPFDSGRIPHDAGRVRPGVYVTGWIKRGPTGFIGTNKSCAQETVHTLIADHNAGTLR